MKKKASSDEFPRKTVWGAWANGFVIAESRTRFHPFEDDVRACFLLLLFLGTFVRHVISLRFSVLNFFNAFLWFAVPPIFLPSLFSANGTATEGIFDAPMGQHGGSLDESGPPLSLSTTGTARDRYLWRNNNEEWYSRAESIRWNSLS